MSRVAVDNAKYSLSVVDKAISLCSLLHHTIRQLQKVFRKPVREPTTAAGSNRTPSPNSKSRASRADRREPTIGAS
jgi:hypothetical protein